MLLWCGQEESGRGDDAQWRGVIQHVLPPIVARLPEPRAWLSAPRTIFEPGVALANALVFFGNQFFWTSAWRDVLSALSISLDLLTIDPSIAGEPASAFICLVDRLSPTAGGRAPSNKRESSSATTSRYPKRARAQAT